ncbi:MAG: type II toxin-antitoxin system HicA family toxin [Desulfonatronovibrionaceae bacterium]
MNKKQRQILERILEQPVRSDIPWSDIEKLFRALGADLSEGRGSRVRVALEDVKAIFHSPHPERLGNQATIRAVRRFLKEAGVKR